MSESLPRRMATVTRQATTAGVVLTLAYLLSQFLPRGAVGPLETSKQPLRDQSQQEETGPTVRNAQLRNDEPAAEPQPVAVEQPDPAATGVLTVLIVERDYFLMYPDAAGEMRTARASLNEVRHWADRARGDANGIRVRVLRSETARASAEQQLLSELNELGIGGDQIYMPGELLP